MRSSPALAAAFGLLLALTGCHKPDPVPDTTRAQPPAAPGRMLRLELVTSDDSDEWAAVRAGCNEAAATLPNVTLDFQVTPDASATTQKRIVDDLLARNVDAIALCPVEPAAQTTMLDETARQTLLLTMGRDAADSARACYVGTDAPAFPGRAATLPPPRELGRRTVEVMARLLTGGRAVLPKDGRVLIPTGADHAAGRAPGVLRPGTAPAILAANDPSAMSNSGPLFRQNVTPPSPAGDPPAGNASAPAAAAKIFTLRNAVGCEARITNYGGIVLGMKVPDRTGKFDDVVLGFDDVSGYTAPGYVQNCPYFGALIGRYGNRIAKGQFKLGERSFQVPTNDGNNALHGGKVGFDKCLWDAHETDSPDGAALVLNYVSADGEQGFPGTVKVKATYTLTARNELVIEFEATTDQETVVNLTNHAYFNLKGAGKGDILDHEVMLPASAFVAIDKESIPLGGTTPVAGTPFDFTRPTLIGARIDESDEQLKNAKGYDHTFVVDGYRPGSTTPRLLARVTERTTGRALEVESTEPGVQFYSGNFLDGTLTGKGGLPYRHRDGFCLEPQHFPDSPNRPEYPSTTLRPGETYRHRMIYRFSTTP